MVLGTPEVSLDLFFQTKKTETSNSNISRSSLTPTTFYVSRRYMVRTSIFRLFRCWLHDLPFLVLFPENENAGGSAICIYRDLLPEEAIVTHLITCQGRDHLVKIQSERHNLVIVNVHFEPELTLRQLRGRLHLIHPHWPSYPSGVCIILGDFNICDPEEGRFHVWNQTFTDGDREKLQLFSILSSHMSLRLLNLITREGTPQPLGPYVLCQGLIASLTYLWLRRVIITATPMSLKTIRVITQQYVLSFKRPTPRGHLSKRIPSWMSKHPIFCSLLQRLHDDHRFSTDPFGVLAAFKVLLNKAKKMTSRELSRLYRGEALNRLYCFAYLQK